MAQKYLKEVIELYTAWDKLAHALGGVVIFAVANLFLPSLFMRLTEHFTSEEMG